MAKTITIPAPVFSNLALVMRISGGVCLGMAAVGVCFACLRNGGFSSIYGAALFSALIGGLLLNRPSTLHEQRAILLKKREVALEKGDPTVHVEVSSDPDIVQMSLLFGFLALFTVPIIFGPAAVVTGIIAANQGHRTALLGIVIGVHGLAVWGTLLCYVVLR
jgi:hypothetical protein